MPFMPCDVLDPSLYEDVRKPLLEASTLPHWCYSSERFYREELARIFHKQWLFVTKSDKLSTPGSYITKTVLGRPVIVLRDESMVARIFINTCLHRNSQIVSQQGCVKALVCPYHKWCYNLSGELIAAPGLSKHRITGEENHLVELKCEELYGLIFVNFDPQCRPLAAMAPGFVELFSQYRVDRLQVAAEYTYEISSNWKSYVEVDMETLHTPAIHGSSIGNQKIEWKKTTGDWVCVYHQSGQTIGLKPSMRHAAVPALPDLSPDALAGTYFAILLPGFFIVATLDCVWWINKEPLGPETTRVETAICFDPDTLARPEYSQVIPHYLDRWRQVVEEDNWITEVQHAGLKGKLQGRYTEVEPVVHYLDNWILDCVLSVERQG